MPDPSGQVYGPYRVVRPLGSGGMGTVLLAEDSRLHRLVALKTFSGDLAGSSRAREHLLNEARAAARLSHPNIAGVHDVIDVGGELVIVFEYVEGQTLADRLRVGRLPVAEAIRIGEQLADGLAAAHAQGVIHRDLKPANVMLAPDGRAKILDFGIARNIPLDRVETGAALHQSTGLFAGTPGYAAPEQWLGDPVGAATDIFALGTVLFEMLTGRRPFQGPSRMAMMQQVLEERRPRVREINDRVPPSIDALIDSALSRDAVNRPASAREFAALLRSADRDLGLRSDTTRSEVTSLRPTARAQRWAIVLAVVLIAVVGVLIATLRGPRPVVSGNATPVVAVLPLTNATGTPANDYLAAGIADSLTTSLASLSGITVLSRAAVMGVWGRVTEPAAIAKELGASYLVEGSVQTSGDRVRLSINLVRPDRTVAWADSAEGLFKDVFELQSRLATTLGRALSVQISAAERAKIAEQPTSNPDALAAYYRGRALLERRDIKGNTQAALAAFDEAVQLDPRFAIAHAARGEALWAKYVDTRDTTAAQQAIDAGNTALRLDPDRANVRFSLAVTLAGSGRLDEAIEEFQRALTLQPNYDDARRELGNVLATQGRLDEAIAEFQKAIAMRPTYAGHYTSLGLRLYEAGRFNDAVAAFQRVVELQPDSASAYQRLGTAYQAMGRYDEALANHERSIAIQPTAQAYSNLGFFHHGEGEYAKAIDAYRAALKLRPKSHITHRNIGDAYRRLGREREARQAYGEAILLIEAELKVNPRDAANLAALAVYLAKIGDDQSAQARIREATVVAPAEGRVQFRAGVVHALGRRPGAALAALRRAVDLGFSRDTIRNDEDLTTLSQLPAFKTLVAPQPSPGERK